MGESQNKSALIAMSGGVDSSAAAYLMQAGGFHCQGATMRLLGSDGGRNAWHSVHGAGPGPGI